MSLMQRFLKAGYRVFLTTVAILLGVASDTVVYASEEVHIPEGIIIPHKQIICVMVILFLLTAVIDILRRRK